MSFLKNFENLLGNAVHGAEQAVGIGNHPQNQGVINDPAPPQLQQQIQRAQQLRPIQPVAMMPQLNAHGQPQYNPAMGGAPNDPYFNQIPLARHIPQLAQQIPSDQHVSDQIYNAIGGLHYDPSVFGQPADNTAQPLSGPRRLY